MRHVVKMLSSHGPRWMFNSREWRPGKHEWLAAAQSVQPEERERIGKFMFKRDAKASMIGRLLIRKCIHDVSGLPYEDIHIGRTEKGKPFLQSSLPLDLKDFNFNVSHQGDLVVLAAERHFPVGIDVMDYTTPRSPSVERFFHTMRRQFTDDEWHLIRHSSKETIQLQTFYRLWCLKESYVKALGIGIGFSVKRLNFKLGTLILNNAEPVIDTKLSVDGEPLLSWRFEECLYGNHIVAVAVDCSKAKDSEEMLNSPVSLFKTLSFTNLIEDIKPLCELDHSFADEFISKPEDPSELKQRQSHNKT